MNLRDQLENIQDKLETLKSDLSEVDEYLEYIADLRRLFSELKGYREKGDRESAKTCFEEIEALVILSDPGFSDLECSVQEILDILM